MPTWLDTDLSNFFCDIVFDVWHWEEDALFGRWDDAVLFVLVLPEDDIIGNVRQAVGQLCPVFGKFWVTGRLVQQALLQMVAGDY